MDTYLIFATPVRSQIALPELPFSAGREPVITVTREAFEARDDAGFTVCHDWRRDDGPVICSSARRGEDYRLSFPGRASFQIRPGDAHHQTTAANETGGATISCSAAPGAGEDMVRQLLLGQVIPRYLAHRGALLLHASAVTLSTGKTVAFLGSSGQGKSTLAAYCQRHGAHLIDDDCILLRFEGEQLSIIGGAPAIRLQADSVHALGLHAEVQQAGGMPLGHVSVSGVAKQQLVLQAGSTTQQPRVLDALLLLDQPVDTPNETAVYTRPATGQVAMMALLHGAFHLDPSDTATMPRVFSQAAAVLDESLALPVHHLCYPRQHERLPDVLQSVLDLQPP